MLMVKDVLSKRRKTLPQNYHKMPLLEKLSVERSDLPSITHIDFSARIQTVDGRYNPRYYALLKAFKELTGIGLLVNTSFNVRGEPIVCNPEEAYRCFMRTEMDYLIMNNFIFNKSDQPPWAHHDPWRDEFKLD